jgi:hypothetical protein
LGPPAMIISALVNCITPLTSLGGCHEVHDKRE